MLKKEELKEGVNNPFFFYDIILIGDFMKNKRFNYMGAIGIVLYVIITLIDRVILKLPDLIYIVSLLIALIFVIIGIVLDKRKK